MDSNDGIPLRDHLSTMAEERATRLQNAINHLDRMTAEVARRLDQRVDYEAQLSAERDRRYTERFIAQEAATLYMRQITNEFRGQLRDQAANFITRTESLARAQANADKIEVLATRLDRNEGKSGLTDPLLEGMAKEIKEIKAIQLGYTGEKAGRDASLKMFVLVVGLIVSLLTIGGVIVSVAFAIRQ